MASTFTNLPYHIVFGTKYRQQTIGDRFQNELDDDIGGIFRDKMGSLLGIGGIPDHVHILAKLSPTIAVSNMLRLVKSNSSKWMNESNKTSTRFEWQTGFAASVSESQVPEVERYIQNQQDHHPRPTFK